MSEAEKAFDDYRWHRNTYIGHCSDSADEARLHFLAGFAAARRTPPPATKELLDRFKLYIDDLDPDGTDLTWFEIGVEVQYMKKFLAEWPGPAKEES